MVNGTADNVLRLLPPLNLTREEADAGLAIIENAFKSAPIPKCSCLHCQMKRDFIDLSSLSAAELTVCSARRAAQGRTQRWLEHPYLRGKTLAMIFQKPSLRTRITFETGMAQLGGHAIYLAPQDIGIGERESVKDVARNLSRWVDLIMIRTFSHATAVELAREASVPVINGLTDLLHPCQLLADLMTLRERFGRDLRSSASRLWATASTSRIAGSRRPRSRVSSFASHARTVTSPTRISQRLRREESGCSLTTRPRRYRRRRGIHRHLGLDGPGEGGRAAPARFQGVPGESRTAEESGQAARS